jgi:iron(III) transport system ATP-binding protein
LLGPSGCGKTTTLRCIAGLERPDRGMIRLGETVFFDEQRRINVPLNRRDIGMVFQSYAIWPHMSVFENVAFPLKVAKGQSYSGAEVKRLVGEALDRVALTGFEQRSPTQLSGGQQQRVALARAIVRHPQLLLLDEPLSNLDAKLRDEMRHELKSLQKRIGVTTVYVTHDQSEALEMSDVIAVVNQGRLAQIGTPQEIFFEPCDAFVAGFMGSTNLLSGNTLASAVKGTIGGVSLDVGGTIACRFRNDTAAKAPTVVSVRPECIELKARTAPPRDGWNSLDGTVVGSGFLGQSSRYSIRVRDLTLLAHVPSSVKFVSGNEVSVTFPQDAAIGLPVAQGG